MREVVNQPYGGRLVERFSPRDPDPSMRRIEVRRTYALDAEKIGIGAYSPLEGFMTSPELQSVLRRNELGNGLPWTIPVVLGVQAKPEEGDQVLLTWGGRPLAILEVEETFSWDKRDFAEAVYGTLDPEHPGVVQVMNMEDFLVGGRITLISRITSDSTPMEVREEFSRRGWKRIAAYQTRNPPHRAHEHVQRHALELVDGLFIHPVVGELKGDDFPPQAILEAYSFLVENFYPREVVILDTLTITMRYAGPKAAVFLATVRKNYGCTHYIVGRDMAGVGSYYDPYAAQRLLTQLNPGIELLPYPEVYYCRRCEGTVTEKTCCHREEWVKISMTKVRQMLRQGLEPPREMIRPEVASILGKYLRGDPDQGKTSASDRLGHWESFSLRIGFRGHTIPISGSSQLMHLSWGLEYSLVTK